VSFSIKEYPDRYELLQAGEHDRQSHVQSSGILSPKQRSAIARSVRASPLSGASEVMLNLKNLSPGKRVAHDARSTGAVRRLVRKERSEVMASRTPGVLLDGSEGSMIELAESLSLQRFIDRHNDPDDPYHLTPHEVVCCAYQFKNGVRYMHTATPSMLSNLALSVNSGWQTQFHLDGAYNFCRHEFGIIGIGMNSMGARFNPVSLSIVNSESKASISACWDATVRGFYSLYTDVDFCDAADCAFCTRMKQTIEGPGTSAMRNLLASEHVANGFFPIDKPSSDNSKAFFSFCKETFGEDIPVLQCSNHIGGTNPISPVLNYSKFWIYPKPFENIPIFRIILILVL
jgi:hypothetical protein